MFQLQNGHSSGRPKVDFNLVICNDYLAKEPKLL